MLTPKRVFFPLAVLVTLSFGAAGSAYSIATSPEILGPDAPSCAPDSAGPAVLLHIDGFKDRKGHVRAELYPPTQADFVAPGSRLRAEGKTFRRIDVPTPESGEASICVQLPGPGTYAMAVMHDRDADSHLDVFSDGFGFPNNPRVGFAIPDVAKVAFTVTTGVTSFEVLLNYWTGFSAHPIKKN